MEARHSKYPLLLVLLTLCARPCVSVDCTILLQNRISLVSFVRRRLRRGEEGREGYGCGVEVCQTAEQPTLTKRHAV